MVHASARNIHTRATRPAPLAGWGGVISPDPELSEETLRVLSELAALPSGQRDAILARGVGRFLSVQMEIDEESSPPTESDMVECTSALSNIFHDFLGNP